MVTKKKCFKFHFKNGYNFATYCKYENEAVVAYIYMKTLITYVTLRGCMHR